MVKIEVSELAFHEVLRADFAYCATFMLYLPV